LQISEFLLITNWEKLKDIFFVYIGPKIRE